MGHLAPSPIVFQVHLSQALCYETVCSIIYKDF